jgi:hypothetical protein
MNGSKLTLLNRIAQHLLLQESFEEKTGLLNGKMAFAIFFFHYAGYTGNLLYEDFAISLIDEIQEEVYAGMPFCLDEGICGIGWGIEYLIQEGFVDADADFLLEDVDRYVMQIDVPELNDMSLAKGVTGIAGYVCMRYQGKPYHYANPFLDKKYVLMLLDKFYHNQLGNIPEALLLEKIVNGVALEKNECCSMKRYLQALYFHDNRAIDLHNPTDVIVENGCVGLGLKLLMNPI